jgi:ArsR family transcriptional regulator, arsenate/arsenite/antimonite-responsive transcriptional repressor
MPTPGAPTTRSRTSAAAPSEARAVGSLGLVDGGECCAPVSSDALNEAQSEILARSFAALADPIRLRMLSLITSAPAGEVCACDLVEPSGRSQPTVSHHMKILVDAGLVEREKRGLWVWYRPIPARLEALRSALG